MTYALEIANLRKTYGSGFKALLGISFAVKAGDFFALLGPNGAGKSTTIGIITSLINLDAGQVRVFGVDAQRRPSEAKSKIGLVPQEFNFNQFTPVIEALINQAGYYGLPRGLAAARAEKYLRQLDLWEKRDVIVRELSGGMKRRLIITRALLHEPQLLILDEPTAGVDIEVRRMIWNFMTELNRQGTTIILTTHYLEEAETLCRNIAIIDRGEIIENTSMRELLEKLEGESYLLYLGTPITSVPQLNGLEARIVDPVTLEITVSRKINLNPIFSLLQEQGISVVGIKNKANRLEELFLRLIT